MFNSRVAENANRRSRLIFPISPQVPTPTKGEQGFPCMPSWMQNRDDPFGPDVSIPPLQVPTISTGSVSSLESDLTSDDDELTEIPRSDEDEDVYTCSPKSYLSSGRKSRNERKRSEMEGKTGNADFADIRSIPLHFQTYMKPPVLPMPAFLLAGSTTAPMLSTLANGVLVNRMPQGMDANNGEVTVSVALPGKYRRQNSKGSRKPRSRDAFKSGALSKVDIPQTPFDPFAFGQFTNNQTAKNVIERPSVLGLHPNEDGNEADDERFDTHSQDDEAHSEDEGTAVATNGSRSNATNHLRPLRPTREVPPLPNENNSQRPRSGTCTSSIHHSFLDLRCSPIMMLERRARSEPSTSRSSIPNSSEYFSADAEDESEKESKKVHLNGATKQAQVQNSSSREPQRASTEAADDSPSERNPPATGTAEEMEQTQEGLRSSKSFGKSIMRKIRKIGQRKKPSQVA